MGAGSRPRRDKQSGGSTGEAVVPVLVNGGEVEVGTWSHGGGSREEGRRPSNPGVGGGARIRGRAPALEAGGGGRGGASASRREIGRAHV